MASLNTLDSDPNLCGHSQSMNATGKGAVSIRGFVVWLQENPNKYQDPRFSTRAWICVQT